MKKIIPNILVLFLLVSCDIDDDLGCVCTTEFIMITILVVDSLDNPIDSLNVSIEDEFGRQIIPIDKQLPFLPGRYTVIDDSFVGYLTLNPLLLHFKASDTLGRNAQAFIVVNTDECYCHVNKLSGPDKSVLK